MLMSTLTLTSFCDVSNDKFDFVVHHKIATILRHNKIKLVMPHSRFWNIVISQKNGYFDITKPNLWILKIYHCKYLKFRTIFWDIKIRFFWYPTKQKRICLNTIQLTYSSRIYDVICKQCGQTGQQSDQGLHCLFRPICPSTWDH